MPVRWAAIRLATWPFIVSAARLLTRPSDRVFILLSRLSVSEFMERDHYFGIGEPAAFAGLWESWLGEDGEIETATLLTTEPNAEVQGAGHHPMPVLLATPEDRRDWLIGGADERLVTPFVDGALAVRGK